MKNRVPCFLPQTLVVCIAPLIACTSALASVINFNEQSSANVWTFQPGTNLLATATPSPATATSHEGSSSSWALLTDSLLGTPSETAASVTPNNNESVTYALDILAKPEGYNITSFDSYGAWGDSGRDNQDYTIQYSTVTAPTTFITIATVGNHTGNPDLATHTTLTDTTGFLAMGVHSIKINFANQENGYTGFREFILRADSAPATSLNESNTTNVWTLPAGANLLNGSTASPTPAQPVHGGDVASGSWTTVTDNSVGTASNFLTSVTPNNGNIVTFPLDVSVNFNGYNISSFDSYCAWANSGRDNQDFSIRYSTVAEPTKFIPLGAVVNRTGAPLLATHSRLTPSSGFLATGVAAIQLYFNQQENSYTGFREFIALGTAVSISDPLTWTGASGSAGNASWIADPDSNWMRTDTGLTSNYNPIAALAFDSNGTNRNLTIPTALTASSLTFINDGSTPFTIGGALITVTNDIASSGSGTATFTNSLFTTTGVSLTGTGSLVFNSDLQSPGLTLSGTGSITLNAESPLLSGNVSVSNGNFNVGHNLAMEHAALTMTGGTANFTTAAPALDRLAGTAGTIVLGSTTSPVLTNLSAGSPNATVITSFGGNLTQATGDTGRFTKTGLSSLTLAGDNSYTGPTNVEEGTLEFGQVMSLYHGLSGSWTASNIVVAGGATLGFKVGSAGEFTDGDMTLLSMDGFQAGTKLGLNTTADFTLTRGITAPVSLFKTGPAVLTLTGTNTYTGTTTVIGGTIHAANPSGISLPGNVTLGDGSADATLNFGADNQFGPDSVLTLATGPSVPNGKVNLRGTNQTIAGLESASNMRVSLIQNDEIGQPGYTVDPGPASLTIHTMSDHSYYGIIREQNGGTITLNKTGTATQELGNLGIAGYYHKGMTNVLEGTLKLNFINTRNTTWDSPIAISSRATFELAGIWNFFRTVSGQGQLVKSGTGMISLCNVDGYANANSYSGGTVIKEGILKFYSNGSTGEGTADGQFCVAGPMNPSNVITVKNGASMGIGYIAALGNSPVLPQYAPTILLEPGGKLWGGEGNNLAFLANINLNGDLNGAPTVEITTGSDAGGFNSNMTFVGIVKVGGTTPTTIVTTGLGAFANISLGSVGLPGTTFEVANVTANSNVDLTISSVMKDVIGIPSPLTKTGSGTMFLPGIKSYTGMTHVAGGELRLDSIYLADTAGVTIDAAATLNLLFSEADTVSTLTLEGVQVAAGTYGSTTNTTAGVIQTPRIKGDGTLLVTTGPVTDPYTVWASVIPNANDRDKTDDPDGDGFSNLSEFLFGTSPIANNGALTTFESTPSGLIIRWNQRAVGTSIYVLQESTTLISPWSVSAAPITDNSAQDLPDYVRKEALIPLTGGNKFVRVEATE